jgi:hypothetical protein
MTEQTLTGSCLCGGLKYRVSGEPTRFYHCHCQRCRKASGAAHTSNLFVENGTLEFEGDTSLMRQYKLPEAERFSRYFCATCGGPVPKEIPDFKLIFVPAGTLDDEPNIRPQARIFQDSRASWSCEGEELPLFADYPK